MMKYAALLILLTLQSQPSWAQQPYFVSLNKSNGLPSNSVYNVFQDQRGFIWLACNEGLSRYDGFEFKTYRSNAQTSAAGTNIKEDAFGRIWYQNFDGYVYYVEDDTLKSISQKKPVGFIPFGITDKYLFTVQRHGVDVFDIGTLEWMKTLPIDYEHALHSVSSTKNFYLAVDNSLYLIDQDLDITNIDLTLNSPMVEKHLYQLHDQLYVVFKNNSGPIHHLKNNQLHPVFHASGIEHIQGFNKIDSVYWLLSQTGALRHNYQGQVMDQGQALFPEYSISFVMKDRQDNYWISTVNEGILLVPNINHSLNTLEPYQGFRINYGRQSYLIGSKKKELIQLNKDLSQQLVFQDQEAAGIQYVYYDSVQQQYYYISRTLFRYDPVQKKRFNLRNLAIKDIYRVDHTYFAFAASGNSGLMKVSDTKLPSKWDPLFEKNKSHWSDYSFLLTEIRGKSVTYLPSQEAIYFATNVGLFKVSPDTISEITDQGETLYLAKLYKWKEQIWALSTKGDIVKIENDVPSYNNLEFGIPSDDIIMMRLCHDYLFVVRQKSLEAIALNDSLPTVNRIDISINTFEINDLLYDKGQLLLVTDQGIVSLQPRFNQVFKKDARFYINYIKANEEIISNTPLIRLRPDQNHVEINYSLLSFGSAFSTPVYYKINNENWNQLPSETRTLKFPALASGAYSLSFKTAESDVEVAKIQLLILAPFWRQAWFIACIILLAISIAYVYYRWQTGLLKNQNRLLEEKINLEQSLSKSMLTSIKSQMNPHFFYNALNTIQSYIFSNDKRNASNYLAKFSKLTRMVLEMSDRETIYLHEEVVALTLYLELEKMRFNNEFEFTLHLEESIDTDMIKIPSMIIQPYVENAVKHGLLHKRHDRKLEIICKQINQHLLVSIDDNGIGRKRSEELNKIKTDKHQSFSSGANEKRLEILNKGKDSTLSIQIIDKYNEDGLATGTRVELYIPIS